MKNLKYIFFSFLLLGLWSCNEVEDVLEDNGVSTPEDLPALSIEGTGLDFSNYVAIGASFTAGFTDNSLFIAAQETSFPNTMASKFGLVGGGNFTQPLMTDNIGGFIGQSPRLYFYNDVDPNDAYGSGPYPLGVVPHELDFTPEMPTTNPTVSLSGPFNNYGIPGAKSFHLVTPGYGAFNPYFGRMASNPSATVLDDAVAQNPTFFTISEVGGNDVLGYALSGGTGVYQAGNPDPSTYAGNDITDPGVFAVSLNDMVSDLTSNGADGVIATVPNITNLSFFTTIPNNALELDAATAANLTGFFQAVSGIFAQGLILQGVPTADALALAAQYAIVFNEGPNRFLIDVDPSPSNPLGFRQMMEEELLLLTIDSSALVQGYGSAVVSDEVLQVLGLLQGGGTPTPQQAQLVLDAVSGIDDQDALDSEELGFLAEAVSSYNATITQVASDNDLALVDLDAILEQASSTDGITFDDYTLNTSLVFGGLVSLDGVHLNARGYALMANSFLQAIDNKYGSNFEASGNLANAGDFPTNFSSDLE